MSETKESRQTSFNRAGCGKHHEPTSLCSNRRDEIHRESLQDQQNADGKFEDEQTLVAQAGNSQDADEKARGIDSHHEGQLDQSNHNISRDEDIDRDCFGGTINRDETARKRKTAGNSQDTTKHNILVDRGSIGSASNTGERALSLASLECFLEPVTLNTCAVNSQKPQPHAYPSNMPEDTLIDAGGGQANRKHAYTTSESATLTSWTFGSVDYQQLFTPFTQQILQFDYFSQASLPPPKISVLTYMHG
jgi:hypothetical protein